LLVIVIPVVSLAARYGHLMQPRRCVVYYNPFSRASGSSCFFILNKVLDVRV